MPSNTSVHDLIFLVNRLNCIRKARKAEFELSHYRKHGKLPDNAQYIVKVWNVNGKELIEVKDEATV